MLTAPRPEHNPVTPRKQVLPNGSTKRKGISPLERAKLAERATLTEQAKLAERTRRFARTADDVPMPKVVRQAHPGGRIRTNAVPNLMERVAQARRQARRERSSAGWRDLLKYEVALLGARRRRAVRGSRRRRDGSPRASRAAIGQSTGRGQR